MTQDMAESLIHASEVEWYPFNFGYLTDKGCDICGKTPAQVEPRFLYTACQEHSKLSPAEFSKQVKVKS